MKIYLAATYGQRAEMEKVADRLKGLGFDVVSRWVYGIEECNTREKAAILDLEDVDRSDVVLSFTHPRGTLTSGGGRHVEFGYAFAKGKKADLIGHRENVFHHHPGVQLWPDIDTWIDAHIPGWAE